MSKFLYALCLVFATELALFLFGGSTFSNSTLLGFLLYPSTWQQSAFWIALLVGLTALGVSTIIPGSFVQVNIYALYAGLALVALSFGISLFHLSSFMYGALKAFTGVTPALVITSFVIAPLIVFYITAVMEWVRAN